jgi:hypothetical protein
MSNKICQTQKSDNDYYQKYMKYKNKYSILKNQIGGYSEDDFVIFINLYKQFIKENEDTIKLTGMRNDHSIIEEQKEKYINCYQSPFKEIIRTLFDSIKYIKFEEFNTRIKELCDILIKTKKENEIYVITYLLGRSSERETTFNKSEIWVTHLASLYLLNCIDFIVNYNDMSTSFKNIVLADKYKDKHFVFICWDDCAYSGTNYGGIKQQIHSYCESINIDIKEKSSYSTLLAYDLDTSLINEFKFKFNFDPIDNSSFGFDNSSFVFSNSQQLNFNYPTLPIPSFFLSKIGNVELTNTDLKRILCSNDIERNDKINSQIKYNSQNLLRVGNAFNKNHPQLELCRQKIQLMLNDIWRNNIPQTIDKIRILFNTHSIGNEKLIEEIEKAIKNTTTLVYAYAISEIDKICRKLGRPIEDIKTGLTNILYPCYDFVILGKDRLNITYFDFTFADGKSLNLYFLSGNLIGKDADNYLDTEHAELTEKEKTDRRIPFIKNCVSLSNNKECFLPVYKQIKYKFKGFDLCHNDVKINNILPLLKLVNSNVK